VARLTAVPRPLVTDAGAAGEADAAVDDQDAAVIAMVEALERERVDRVVAGEVTAVSAQQLAKRLATQRAKLPAPWSQREMQPALA